VIRQVGNLSELIQGRGTPIGARYPCIVIRGRGTPVSRLRPRMLLHVIRKVGTLREPFAAYLADMRLLPRMRIHVRTQVA